MTTVLHLDAVTRVHGEGATEVMALKSVTFRAHAGELVAIMGPSGLRQVHAAHPGRRARPADRRQVSVEGVDLATLGNKGRARMRRTSIGYVFQDFNLIPALTAIENVALPRELDGERSRAARRSAMAALDEVGIGDLAAPVPRRDVRRPAAAGRDRPRDRRRPPADPRRRADRRPRHRDRRGDPAPAAVPLRRGRGRRTRHPRGAARRLGRPRRLPARRDRRRRVRGRPGRAPPRARDAAGEPAHRSGGSSLRHGPARRACARAVAASWCWS